MKTITAYLGWSCAVLSFVVAQSASITLTPAATGFEGDNTGFVYGVSPLLVSNDGSAAKGGFRAFSVANKTPFTETTHAKTGRSKVAVPVHDIGDSLFRAFEAESGEKVNSNNKRQLGDWSTACLWRSQESGESYLFLFGKKMAVQLLVRAQKKDVEILEVQTFAIPIEGETCSVFSSGQVFFSAEDQALYAFQASETTSAPEIKTVNSDIKVSGLATYHNNASDYLFVAHDGTMDVYDSKFQRRGSIALSGIPELSIEGGEGFGAFDLQGKLLQHLSAEEPNNVDIIYNFTLGTRRTGLAFAACRGDNTMCFVEINSTGLIKPVSGGVQPLPDDYEPYGSCNYGSRTSGKEYLFVNNKEAKYLQYELTSTANGTLQTKLVREFQGGSGGQVEGCVADEGTGYLFVSEEPSGIWRYEAEPDSSNTGTEIAKVGDASGLKADVEGITLVLAKNALGGYIIVSSQGISSYLVYERAPPHKYVLTFTIVDNAEQGIDHVSNTDGIAAVGNALNKDFPYGLVVTHDDANELPEGGTAEQASFKLTSLADILGEERVELLGY